MIYLLPHKHCRQEFGASDITVEEFLAKRFLKRGCVVTPFGRTAVGIALERFGLEQSDEVYITTTFEYPHVSSCVTSIVFNYCKPSRVISDKTRAVLVIHEFGVPHPRLIALRKFADGRGIPLIEDCAHTLDSWQEKVLAGTVGDYVICSFPKVFPVPFGGALLGPPVAYSPSGIERQNIAMVQAGVVRHLSRIEDYSKQRRAVFRELTVRFMALGVEPLFKVSDSISPWFFPVPTPKWQECLEFAPKMDVECALWHGTNIVIFPCHQYLNDECISRISEVMGVALRANHEKGII